MPKYLARVYVLSTELLVVSFNVNKTNSNPIQNRCGLGLMVPFPKQITTVWAKCELMKLWHNFKWNYHQKNDRKCHCSYFCSPIAWTSSKTSKLFNSWKVYIIFGLCQPKRNKTHAGTHTTIKPNIHPFRCVHVIGTLIQSLRQTLLSRHTECLNWPYARDYTLSLSHSLTRTMCVCVCAVRHISYRCMRVMW